MALPVAPQRIAVNQLQDLMVEQEEERDRTILLIAIAAVRRRRRRREQNERRPRRWWVRPWLTPIERQLNGIYHNLFVSMDRYFEGDYRSFLRLDRNIFNEVLQRVGPLLQKNEE